MYRMNADRLREQCWKIVSTNFFNLKYPIVNIHVVKQWNSIHVQKQVIYLDFDETQNHWVEIHWKQSEIHWKHLAVRLIAQCKLLRKDSASSWLFLYAFLNNGSELW